MIRKNNQYTAIARRWFYLVCLLMALGACASAPVQEMSDARQAIRAAKEAGANSQSQTNLQKAEQLLKQAQQALEHGEYKMARNRARAARDEALEAQKNTN